MTGKFFLYPFQKGEKITLKKMHPCGGREWEIRRVGAEILICCETCKRVMAFSRAKLEKMCVKITFPASESENKDVK